LSADGGEGEVEEVGAERELHTVEKFKGVEEAVVVAVLGRMKSVAMRRITVDMAVHRILRMTFNLISSILVLTSALKENEVGWWIGYNYMLFLFT
jgi:hypothetical protein